MMQLDLLQPLAQGHVAGVDEAGRGPLAGPVYAAAVILDPARGIDGIADSKKLTARARQYLAVEIKERSLAWAARFRRLARDHERLDSPLAGIHWLAFVYLMLNSPLWQSA